MQEAGRGWTREREKNMLKDREEEGRKGKKKEEGKKNPRDGKHYINSEMLAPSWARDASHL